ncbi:MAG: LPXTG cell wall anchor domain-containing protein [Geodermatophilaceae bacterium]|nr:LPXTG cell wall anchor domain-containing protein [Geodermatophilaceae bacterium]
MGATWITHLSVRKAVMPRLRSLRRPAGTSGAVLLATGLAATGLLVGWPGSALAAPVTTDPAQAAAGWLAAQFVDGDGDGVGDHMEVTIDLNGDGEITDDERFPDYGLTADSVVALAAAGVAGEASTAASDYLEANVELYVGDADVDDDGVDDPDGEYYAGALAKTLLIAAVTGRDGADFGGVDLVSRLLFTETPDGRYSDVSEFGDFSNSIGQSLAVLALARTAPDELSAEAKTFLAGQQCADGGPQDGNVPLTLGADACAAEAASVDTTSFAVQALRAIDFGQSVDPALDFLLRSQDDDGGFSDLGVTNANSTGLAAQALGPGERDDEAVEAAVQWLLSRQLGCATPPEQQGAVAFTDGPDGTPVFDDRAARATVQAVPGIVGVGLSDVDAAGSSAAAPRLDCGPAPSPSPGPPPTDPGPTATSTPTAPGPTPSDPGPTAGPAPTGPGLPVTGTAISEMLLFAGAVMVLGAGLLLATRRRAGLHR